MMALPFWTPQMRKLSDRTLARRLEAAQDRRMAAVDAIYAAHENKTLPFAEIVESLGEGHRLVRRYRAGIRAQGPLLVEARDRCGNQWSIPCLIERLRR